MANSDVESRINSYFIISSIDEYLTFLRGRVRIGDNIKISSFEKIERMMNKWELFFESKNRPTFNLRI